MNKGTAYPGGHEAIIDQARWDKANGVASSSVSRILRLTLFAPHFVEAFLEGRQSG